MTSPLEGEVMAVGPGARGLQTPIRYGACSRLSPYN